MAQFDDSELLALARIDLEKERFADALSRVKIAISRPGGPPEAWSLLGAVYLRLQLWQKAQHAFSEYLRSQPDAVNERFQLGMAHFEAADLDAALRTWSPLNINKGFHPPALFYSALAGARSGRLALAVNFCKVLLETVPADNLFYGRAKDLSEKIQSDPRFSSSALEGVDLPPETQRSH